MAKYTRDQCNGPVRPFRTTTGDLHVAGYVRADAPSEYGTTFWDAMAEPVDSIAEAEDMIFLREALAWVKQHVKPRDYKIYLLWLSGMRQPAIKNQVNVSQGTVSRVVRRVTGMLRDEFGQVA